MTFSQKQVFILKIDHSNTTQKSFTLTTLWFSIRKEARTAKMVLSNMPLKLIDNFVFCIFTACLFLVDVLQIILLAMKLTTNQLSKLDKVKRNFWFKIHSYYPSFLDFLSRQPRICFISIKPFPVSYALF